MNSDFNIALIGNPNCGKTSIFNNLTGARQKVGNWPGVTVEKKSGIYTSNNHNINVTDLPGIYSLTQAPQNNSIDQQITNYFVNQEQTDLYINILDATNIKRNLYLSLQLKAKGLPCLVVLNMIDKLRLRKINIDEQKLSEYLQCPVISISSTQNTKENTEKLKKIIHQELSKNKQNISKKTNHITDKLGLNLDLLNSNLQSLEYFDSLNASINILESNISNKQYSNTPGLLLEILESEQDNYPKNINIEDIKHIKNTKKHIESHYQDDIDIIIADLRYQLINIIYSHITSNHDAKQVANNNKSIKSKLYHLFNAENLDNIVINKYLGIPIFLFILYSIFEISISFGEVLKPFFELTSGFIVNQFAAFIFYSLGLPEQLSLNLTEGLATGFVTVSGFIPQISLMFILLTFLEDSGYMARAAFVMDRIMQAAGLPGKSFVPLIISFGCNVPAILSTRTLDNTRDRILTCLMSPFMSCSARLAIFIVFASAFFPKHQALMVFLLYVTGILVAILTGLLLKATVLTGKPVPFILELPSYNIPTLKNITIATWQRCRGFITRAGKLIIPICIGLQLINSIDTHGNWINNSGHNNNNSSILESVSKSITPVLNPIGVSNDNWPATVGLITGSLAKEVVIGTLNTLYSNDLSNNTDTQDSKINNNNFISGLGHTIIDATNKSQESFTELFSTDRYNLASKKVSEDEFSNTAFNKLNNAFPSTYAAFAYCLFVLLYMPCLSTFSILMKEIGRSWAIASLIWSLDIAYITATTVYQLSIIAINPLYSSGILIAIIISHILIYNYLKSGKLSSYFSEGSYST